MGLILSVLQLRNYRFKNVVMSEAELLSPIWLGDNVWDPEFDPEFDEKSVQTSHRLKAVYEKVAQDYGIEFLAAFDYATYSQADREHMDAENHGKLAATVEEKLRKLLS